MATNKEINRLVKRIGNIHKVFVSNTKATIDKYFTLRNWLMGYYIFEYEQKGVGRAEYGGKILAQLIPMLKKAKVTAVSLTNLKLYRQFYLAYPQIGQTASDQLTILLKNKGKDKYLISQNFGKNLVLFDQNSKEIKKRQVLDLVIPGEELLNALSFSHFVELLKINDLYKRMFYEMDCIRSSWSVRELRRQINSLYYERAGFSKDKAKLVSLMNNKKHKREIDDEIHDPYVFEFLGIKMRKLVHENNLRDALINKLHDFMLELGKGFCYEDKNKKILIGDRYYYVDLVFYHRILKCHVLVELKLEEFAHKHVGQLNAYLNYYKRHEMVEGDNPPIGILLCTEKDNTLAEYSLDGVGNKLFISKYQLELPAANVLRKFVEEELKELQGLSKLDFR